MRALVQGLITPRARDDGKYVRIPWCIEDSAASRAKQLRKPPLCEIMIRHAVDRMYFTRVGMLHSLVPTH